MLFQKSQNHDPKYDIHIAELTWIGITGIFSVSTTLLQCALSACIVNDKLDSAISVIDV